MEVFGTFSKSVRSHQQWSVYKALAATSASIMHSHNARFVTTAYSEVMITVFPAVVQSTEAGMVAIGMAYAHRLGLGRYALHVTRYT